MTDDLLQRLKEHARYLTSQRKLYNDTKLHPDDELNQWFYSGREAGYQDAIEDLKEKFPELKEVFEENPEQSDQR